MATSAQYWRVFINGPTNGASVAAIAEMALYGAGNLVALSLSGCTFTASSVFGGTTLPASNAFDLNPSTLWASQNAPTALAPEWLQVQFPSAVSVAFISIAISNGGGWPTQSTPTFLLQSSPNGTTWTTQSTVTNFNWVQAGQIAYFDVSTTLGYLRLSQAAVEVVEAPSSHLNASQVTVETVYNAEPNTKISQINVEILLNAEPNVKLSQVCVEVMFPYIVATPSQIQQFLLP